MSAEPLISGIAEQIEASTGTPFRPSGSTPVAGGDINRALLLEDGERRFFVKLNRADRLGMFEAEAEGLLALAEAGALMVPEVITVGTDGDSAWLVLAYIPLQPLRGDALRALGTGLARMHATTRAQYGWHRDNTIGTTSQPNPSESDWPAFWRRHRLAHQLAIAARQGHGGELQTLGARLGECLEDFFSDYTPAASLLHGDLWGGNAAMDEQGRPFIYDPAVYYGDRESDLAMTELFGGFGGDFRAAYEAEWPLDSGYIVRRDLYQLYHVLNHLNLFGGGWGGSARQLMQRLLAEAGK